MNENHIIIIIKEDASINLFMEEESSISYRQRNMVDSILCVSKPSFVLKTILFLEIRFNFIISKIAQCWEREDDT